MSSSVKHLLAIIAISIAGSAAIIGGSLLISAQWLAAVDSGQPFSAVAMIEWVGAILGIGGALLIAWRSSYIQFAFGVFCISNILIGTYAWNTSSWGVLTMQVVYFLINLIGVWKWNQKR